MMFSLEIFVKEIEIEVFAHARRLTSVIIIP